MTTVSQKYISIIHDKMYVFVYDLLGAHYMLCQKQDVQVAHSFIPVAALNVKHFALKAAEFVQQAGASGVKGAARRQRANATELVQNLWGGLYVCVCICRYRLRTWEELLSC